MDRRLYSYLLGIGFALIILGLINLPAFAWLHSPGPMNTGHENLFCNDCHLEAEGSLRQQLQENIKFLWGTRTNAAYIGNRPVVNRDCLACHVRDKDKHPVYRFFEPRFFKARQKIQPHYCATCHQEHQGVRVTVDMDYCHVCHDKLALKKDPLDVSHVKLIKDKRWKSCLGCHDYHGGHKMNLPEKLNDLVQQSVILAYFQGEISPYAEDKLYKAKSQRDIVNGE